MRSLSQNQSGQSVAEFGLVLPVLLLIVMATLTLGLMIYSKTVVLMAASQAARTGAYYYNDNSLTPEAKEAKVKEMAMNILNAGLAGTTLEKEVVYAPDATAKLMKVKVKYHFKYVFPLLEGILDKNEYVLEYEAKTIIP